MSRPNILDDEILRSLPHGDRCVTWGSDLRTGDVVQCVHGKVLMYDREDNSWKHLHPWHNRRGYKKAVKAIADAKPA